MIKTKQKKQKKEKTISNFGEAEDKAVEKLMLYGMGKHEAKVLVFLDRFEKGTMKQIEIVADMRQPEVSMAVSKLVKKGQVGRVIPRKDMHQKGRPVHIICRKVSLSKIAEDLYERMKEKLEKANNGMGELCHA